MTSANKHAANRANARASTGPKTKRGKAHACQNARRHGLAVSVLADPVLSNEVEAFARELVGETRDEGLLDLARWAAEAQFELNRARRTRHQLLVDALGDPGWDSQANVRMKLAAVLQCARTAGPLTPLPDNVVEFVLSRPEGLDKLRMVLSDKLHELLLLDRYERRALSKRKLAIRALDQARQHQLENATVRYGPLAISCIS